MSCRAVAHSAALLAALLAGAPPLLAQAPAPQGAGAPAIASPATIPPPAGAPAIAPPTAVPPNGAAAAAGPAEDIRDIRGPKYVLPAWFIPALLAAVAVLALAVYGAWRWYRGRRRPRVLLPFEVALQGLENIRPLMQPVTAREFSIAVSDIVRRYIEERFEVTATHRTTEEFLHDLLESSNPTLARHRGLLSDFLQQCDLVKFGGMSLSLQRMESLHQSARTFVVETAKPEPTDVREPPEGIPRAAASTAAAPAAANAASPRRPQGSA